MQLNTSWVLVYPAEGLEGTYIAHHLEWDVVTFAENPVAAIQALFEAVEAIAEDDARYPKAQARRRAPAELFDVVAHLTNEGERVSMANPDHLRMIQRLDGVTLTFNMQVKVTLETSDLRVFLPEGHTRASQPA